MIAFCGLDCEKCDAFIATKNNDNGLRAQVATLWAKIYQVPVLPEHINCTGCRSEGVRYWYCDRMCEIRKCAPAKGLENCSPCDAFPCGRLEEIFKYAPQAKVTLDTMRKML